MLETTLLASWGLCGKPYFLFPDVLNRWSFQKYCAGIWSFLYYWEIWYFIFSKIWSYPLDWKWKIIFFKKVHGNMIFSSNFQERWPFQKKPSRHMIFAVLSGKMVFFSPKTWYFFTAQKVRGSPSQEIHGNMTFYVSTHGWYKRDATPLCQKMSKMALSRKNTPKGGWRSRLTS